MYGVKTVACGGDLCVASVIDFVLKSIIQINLNQNNKVYIYCSCSTVLYGYVVSYSTVQYSAAVRCTQS